MIEDKPLRDRIIPDAPEPVREPQVPGGTKDAQHQDPNPPAPVQHHHIHLDWKTLLGAIVIAIIIAVAVAHG